MNSNWFIYTLEHIWPSKKRLKKIPLAAAWLDQKMIILSGVRERKKMVKDITYEWNL